MFNHQDYQIFRSINPRRLEELVQEMEDNHSSNKHDAGHQHVVGGAMYNEQVLQPTAQCRWQEHFRKKRYLPWSWKQS